MKLDRIGGLKVLKEIRARYPHLPVILVTGYREEMAVAIEAARQIGAYACLYKPFEIEELLQLLTQVRHQELGRILRVGSREQESEVNCETQDPYPHRGR